MDERLIQMNNDLDKIIQLLKKLSEERYLIILEHGIALFIEKEMYERLIKINSNRQREED